MTHIAVIKRPTADAKFAERLREFDAHMEALAVMRAKNFYTKEKLDWGDVGSLGYLNERLAEALGHYRQEG
jgi:hypothetical protein